MKVSRVLIVSQSPDFCLGPRRKKKEKFDKDGILPFIRMSCCLLHFFQF